MQLNLARFLRYLKQSERLYRKLIENKSSEAAELAQMASRRQIGAKSRLANLE